MQIFTHPGEKRNTLRSQYEFLCFYVCISFPPEEVVTKPCVCVHFFAPMFPKTDCDFLCVTKHFNHTTEFQLRVVWLHVKQAATVCFLCISSVNISISPLPLSCSRKYCLLHGE